MVDSELFKEAGVALNKDNLKKLSIEKEEQLKEQLESMDLQDDEGPDLVDDDDDDDDWDEIGDDLPSNIGNSDTMIINDEDE